MRQTVRVPQLGESAAEATVVAWLVKPGDLVKADQEIVEIQTEKALQVLAAPAQGRLVEVCAEAGKTLAVGEVLAYIELTGNGNGGDGAAPAQPAAAATNAPTPSESKAKFRPPPRPARTEPPARETRGRAAVRAAAGESAFISPRVRSLLQQSGLKVSDLATIAGSGEGGRITAADVEHYLAQGEPMSSVRQAVANAMARSWSRPLATVGRAFRMDALLAHRRGVDGRPSATIYAMRALALALKQGSPLACRLFGNRLHKPATIDLAVAVEIDDGVLTPVIRKVEELDLARLTQVVEEVIAKARAGRVNDAGDAVAAVSNYGTFGLDWATPIPLPGQALLLGIGAVRNAPDWDPAAKGWARVREAEFTITFDHRIADGGPAARLLNAIGEYIEHPERM
jgi:pyruvate/2-oxoglutarate dehydrogenase complex dihydrolipoamide acyltransferase (E2) component